MAKVFNPEARAALSKMASRYNSSGQLINAVKSLTVRELSQKECDVIAHIWREAARKTAKVEGIPTTEEGVVSAYSKAMTSKVKPKHPNYGETRKDWTGVSGRGQSDKDKIKSYKV